MLFKNILIVCIGNICRSPMAEGLLRQALINADQPDCQVGSAGLGALVGHPADDKSCHLMLTKNIDISSHRAQQLEREMVRKADLILTMESSHKTAIEELEPSAKGKVFRLGHWSGFEIPDPYRKELSAFENSLTLIEQGISEWLEKL